MSSGSRGEATPVVTTPLAADFASHGLVAVFEVVDRKRTRRAADGKRHAGPWAVLESVHLFKGPSYVAVLTNHAHLPWQGTSCDAEVSEGDLLLVYAQDEKSISLGGCLPSGRLKGKLEEVDVLFDLARAQSRADD